DAILINGAHQPKRTTKAPLLNTEGSFVAESDSFSDPSRFRCLRAPSDWKQETRNQKRKRRVRICIQAGIGNTSVMFCPNCGQERISEATSFCSRCGYLLTGTADLLKIGGASLM